MKKSAVLLSIILSLQASAQVKLPSFKKLSSGFGTTQNFEVGLMFGPTYYQGELSMSVITPHLPSWQGGGFLRYNFSEILSVRAGYNYGKIKGDDGAWGRFYDPTVQSFDPGYANQLRYYEHRKRNLKFYSKIKEANLIFELNLWNPFKRKVGMRVVPYIFGGLAIFHFNPKTTDRYGTIVELKKYQTEIYKSYKLTQPCIPTGFGIKFNPSETWYVALEVGWRKTFTDWLDDVSHNYAGLPATNDVYLQQLSDRSGEVSPQWGNLWMLTTFNPNEYIRGNPKTKDSYFFCGVIVNRKFKSYQTCTNF